MARNQLTVTDQTRPAEVFNRKFINRTRAFQASHVVDDTQKRPVGDRGELLSLVAVALLRLRVAQIGQAQANDAVYAGGSAAWNNELTAAKTAADIALQGLQNVFREITLPQAIVNLIAATLFPAAPVANAPTTAAAGGTLAAGTYYYKVSALNANGESIGSNEVSVVTAGATSANTITWAAVPGATGYRVYRGTAAGGENVYYAPGNVLTYTDTGAANTAGSPHATNVAPGPSQLPANWAAALLAQPSAY